MRIVHDIEPKNIFEAIEDANGNLENRLVVVIDGKYAGEYALISDGKIAWQSDKDGFVKDHESALEDIKAGAITEIDGANVYTEILGNKKELVICGAGHVSMQIITIGKMLGFKVTVIDDRLKFANDAIERGADEVKFKEFDEALAEIPGNEDTFFVIVTRGHRYDRDCLRNIISKPHAYIGMMGSRRRVRIVKDDLIAEGISRELLESVHTPIGLKIGAETPEEIAVSIMAEIIEVGSGRNRKPGFTQEIMDAVLTEYREKMAMATIVSRKGSAPRGVGTRMLISGDGRIIGTIGGGCIEGNVIAKGRRMLLEDSHKPAIVTVDMTNEAAEDEGMVCGGTVDVLLEIV